MALVTVYSSLREWYDIPDGVFIKAKTKNDRCYIAEEYILENEKLPHNSQELEREVEEVELESEL